MTNSADKLAQFLHKYLYDLSFWYKFSIDRDRNSDHFVNGEYVDENENPVPNIYKEEYFLRHIGCFDETIVFEEYCGYELKKISENSYIKENQLYSIFLNIGLESHYFLIIRSESFVYVIGTYGGTAITFFAKHDYNNFEALWHLLLQSKYFEKNNLNDELVNVNFEILTNIHGDYPPYYLYDIEVKELNINTGVVNNIINSLIKNTEKYSLPFFKNRKEYNEIKKLISRMKDWM